MRQQPECGGCKKPIIGNYLTAGRVCFHPECFTCHGCGRLLDGPYNEDAGNYFHPACYSRHKGLVCDHCRKVLDGPYVSSQEKKYHEKCFRRFVLPRCVICNQPLDGRFVKDAWGNAFHEFHDKKKSPSCHFCFRVLSPGQSLGGGKNQSGENICGICQKTVIRSSLVGPAIAQVMDALGSRGMTGLPRDVPVSLVSRKKLDGMRKSKSSGNTQGFTHTRYTRDGRQETTDHHIYILRGVPLLCFKAILGHELVHVWQNENRVRLPEVEEEGLCELGASWVLEADASAHAGVLLEAMEKSGDPVYGLGFQRMKEITGRTGVETFLAGLLKAHKK